MQILSIEKRSGYEIREELCSPADLGEKFHAEIISAPTAKKNEAQEFCNNLNEYFTASQEWVVMNAYTPEGLYIGSPKDAEYLIDKKGIKPELAKPTNKVCSIGFCEKEQKWYGWSHRAIYGFGIGDIVSDGDCINSSGWTDDYLEEHPEEDLSLPIGFEAKTLEDAKRMAIAFADSVG